MKVMALTHHPVRLFRLSCGCLREYPMMPVTTRHEVLCITCREAVTTVLAYPERCCAARGRVSSYLLSCTLAVAECTGDWHFDAYADAEFKAGEPRLVRSREGRTGRA